MYLPFARPERSGWVATLRPVEQSRIGPIVYSSYSDPRPTAGVAPRTVHVEDSLVVAFVSRGQVRMQLGRTSVTVGAHRLLIVDGSIVGAIESTASLSLCTLRFPRSALELSRSQTARLSAMPLRASDAAPAVLWALARQISSTQGRLSTGAGDRIARVVVDIVATTALERLGLTTEPEPVRGVLVVQCKQYVSQHLREPDLSPATIAEALHVSVRSLHLAFESEPTSVARLILHRRLEHIRQDLGVRGSGCETIASIGARWGFTSASHFSRVFKGFYGLSPAEWRACTGVAGEVN